MERMTGKRADGRWAIANNDGASPAEQLEKFPVAIARLAAYENTGLEPEEIVRLCSMHERAKMAELLRSEENPPLTLEELREMDGEPVWILAYGINRYDIFTGFSTDELAQFYREALPLRCYGDTWLAYRRKPEERR